MGAPALKKEKNNSKEVWIIILLKLSFLWFKHSHLNTEFDFSSEENGWKNILMDFKCTV